jgi:hypothetical protein
MPTHAPILATFEYHDRDSQAAICGIEVHQLPSGLTVVIATELSKKGGKNISDSTEHMATAACARFHIQPEQLVWIEHYDRTFDEADPRDSFWLVKFGNFRSDHGLICNCPSGRRMTSSDWKSLGLPIPANT